MPFSPVGADAAGYFPHEDEDKVDDGQGYEKEGGDSEGEKGESGSDDRAAKQHDHDGDLEIEGLLSLVIEKDGAVLAC